MPSQLATALQTRLAALREQLEREYGWARLDLEIALVNERVILTGEVATVGLARRIRAALVEVLPASLGLELALTAMPNLAWHALGEPVTRLWRRHPKSSVGPRELATELWPSDAPVAVLAWDREVPLLRARDGTLGWTLDRLGELSEPRPLAAPLEHPDAAARVLAAARSWLGTPYLLGGASREHIDCSALVQRVFVEALGILLARNSQDQLAGLTGGRHDDRAEAVEHGDLLFIHSQREQRTHVGLAGEHGTVVQASRTRSAVIEIGLADYLGDAGWLVRVPLTDVLAWANTQVGRDTLVLPIRV